LVTDVLEVSVCIVEVSALLNELLHIAGRLLELTDSLSEPSFALLVSFLDFNWDEVINLFNVFFWSWLNLGSGTL